MLRIFSKPGETARTAILLFPSNPLTILIDRFETLGGWEDYLLFPLPGLPFLCIQSSFSDLYLHLPEGRIFDLKMYLSRLYLADFYLLKYKCSF